MAPHPIPLPCTLAFPPPSHRDTTTPSPCWAPHFMTQERIMFSNPTPSEPRLSPVVTMSDVTPLALTPPFQTVRSWTKRGESGGGWLREPALLGEVEERGTPPASTPARLARLPCIPMASSPSSPYAVIFETVRSWTKRGESGGGWLREPALLGKAKERGKISRDAHSSTRHETNPTRQHSRKTSSPALHAHGVISQSFTMSSHFRDCTELDQKGRE